MEWLAMKNALAYTTPVLHTTEKKIIKKAQTDKKYFKLLRLLDTFTLA